MTEDALIRQASRDVAIQRLAKRFCEEFGVDGLDMDEDERFTDYLLANHVRPPRPRTERELLIQVAKKALKHEIRRDAVTKQEYRGWHAIPKEEDPITGQLRWKYVDLDRASREDVEKSAQFKIRGAVHDCVRTVLDVQHWNRINSGKADPIDVMEQLDLRLPVAVELAAREMDREEQDEGPEGGDDPTRPSST